MECFIDFVKSLQKSCKFSKSCKLKLEVRRFYKRARQEAVSSFDRVKNSKWTNLTGKIFEIQKKVKQNIHVVKHKLLYIRIRINTHIHNIRCVYTYDIFICICIFPCVCIYIYIYISVYICIWQVCGDQKQFHRHHSSNLCLC